MLVAFREQFRVGVSQGGTTPHPKYLAAEAAPVLRPPRKGEVIQSAGLIASENHCGRRIMD